MDTSKIAFALTGVVPPVFDAEAAQGHRSELSVSRSNSSTNIGAATNTQSESAVDQSESGHAKSSEEKHGLSARKIRSVMAELCSAIRSALDDERGTAEDSLRRAVEILQESGETEPATKKQARGGLARWQIRKVASHIETHLDRSIRNEDLAAIVRLNPTHFGRVFRTSFGAPPHEYVIRRRVERAQGLMLSTDAPLREIALDCGLADQSHLTRLFRRVVGESPRDWRRARLSEPSEVRCPLHLISLVSK